MSKVKRIEQELLNSRVSRGGEKDKKGRKKVHSRSLNRILRKVCTRTQ